VRRIPFNSTQMTLVGAIASMVLLAVALVILNGWVLTYLWQWFVVSTFGLPEIGIARAIGLALVGHLLSGTFVSANTDESGTPFWLPLLQVVGIPLLILGIGYTAHRFM
jgi:hypothetical protein